MFLYLTKHALQLNKEGGKIVITDNETKVTRKIPFNTIEGVVIFGRIQLTTDVMTSFLKAKTPVFFLSKTGRYFGKLDSIEIKNVDLLYRHIEASVDENVSLLYSKKIIIAKIANSITMLRRWSRFGFFQKKEEKLVVLEEGIRNLKWYLGKAENSLNKAELRGYEGSASREYFKVFDMFLKYPFVFEKRTRRPPQNEVNAMLSLGYTLLAQTIQMILNIQWLEVQLGFFHKPKDLKSLLVLDMMEMYRSWIIDDLVIRVLDKRAIKKEHFLKNDKDEKRPVLFNDEGVRIFLREYYKSVFSKAQEESFGNYKKLTLIEKDVENFKQSLLNKEPQMYESFKIK